MRNFICFNVDGEKTFKILAGYHQYFAVKKAVASTVKATATDGKGGVFWHTQGSGKPLSMVFYAHGLQTALDSPTIVVITDRIIWDNLPNATFIGFTGTPISSKDRSTWEVFGDYIDVYNSEGVINLFSDVGTEFSLFDPKFLEEIAHMKEKNLVVELLRN